MNAMELCAMRERKRHHEEWGLCEGFDDGLMKLDGAGRRVLDQIVSDISAEYGLEPNEVVEKGKKPPRCDARRDCYVAARQYGLHYHQIGEYFGRHGTTIAHAVKGAMKRAEGERNARNVE